MEIAESVVVVDWCWTLYMASESGDLPDRPRSPGSCERPSDTLAPRKGESQLPEIETAAGSPAGVGESYPTQACSTWDTVVQLLALEPAV